MVEPPQEAALDPVRQWPRVGICESSRKLRRRQAAGELQQREGIPVCLGDDPVADPLVQPSRERRVQERTRVIVAEAAHLQLLKPYQFPHLVGLTHREDQADRFRQQAAGDEGERQDGRLVQPLGVIDHTDERLLFSDLGQQAEDGKRDEESIRSGPALRPNAVESASLCGSGKRSRSSSTGAQS